MESVLYLKTNGNAKRNRIALVKLLLVYLIAATFWATSSLEASPLVALDPKAASLGNAVTAEQVGSTSALFNPATLTEIRTGREGILREYKLLAAKFPTVEITPTKPDAANDPYSGHNVSVNGEIGTDLFAGDDPRDSAWEPEIDRLSFYLPGYGEIDIDRSILDYVLAPLFYEFKRTSDSKFVFASSLIFLPGGAHFKEESWNLKPTSASIGIFGIAPTIAYEVNPNLSIGFGLEFSAAGTKLGVDYRNTALAVGAVNQLFDNAVCPMASNQFQDLCGEVFNGFDNNGDSILHIYMDGLEDRFNYSFNAGILWKPRHWLSLGVAYQHKTVYKMKGDSGVLVSDDLYALFNGLMDDIPGMRQILVEGKQWSQDIKGTSTLILPFPAKIDLGMSLQLTSKLKVNIDYHWRRSKIFRDAEITFDSLDEPHTQILIATVLGIAKGYVDTDNLGLKPSARNVGVSFKNRGNFAYGLSYSYSERLTLRAGYEKKNTSINAAQPLGPILNDLRTIGLGGNWKLTHDTEVDFAVVNLKSKDYSAAGDSVLTEVGLFPPLSFWGGTNLSSRVEANILQLSYNKRI